MKDFDAERRERHAEREAEAGDRSFVFGGETFTYRPVVSYTLLERIFGADEQGAAEAIRALESTVVEMVEEKDRERFLATVRNPDDPITLDDLTTLCGWLTEGQVGRPTEAPSPSTDGDAKTSTPSTVDSSSPLAEASAA
jgi:hypothetical protein